MRKPTAAKPDCCQQSPPLSDYFCLLPKSEAQELPHFYLGLIILFSVVISPVWCDPRWGGPPLQNSSTATELQSRILLEFLKLLP